MVRHLAGDFGNGRSHFFPACLRDGDLASDGTQRRPNLSGAAARYLDRIGMGVEDLFHHTLAVLHDPTYREQNAGALRMEWPRIPLPGWPDGDTDVAAKLATTVARGRELAGLLDPDTEVKGVTTGKLRPEIKTIAVPATTDGSQMRGDDFALTAGWGRFGKGGVVMPGKGKVVARADTFDVYLNARAYWQNIPAAVWNYKLGGYQVLKKWLSYRERNVLGRALLPEEIQHFTDTARRITAVLLLTEQHIS